MPRAAAAALEDSAGGFVPALIGVLVYLAIVAVAAMLLVGGLKERWRAERDGRIIIQLYAPSAQASAQTPVETATDRALVAIRGIPEIARAEPVSEARLAALLRPWPDTAPLDRGGWPLAVIEVELTPESRPSADHVRERLRAEMPDAIVYDAQDQKSPAPRFLRAIEGMALWVASLLAGTLAATVVFATRMALAAQQETIEILHLLGADDKSILDAVVRRALRTAILGAGVGILLGAATLFFLSWATSPAAGERTGFSLAPAAWGVLGVLPMAAAAIAFVTARLTARRALSEMP